MGFNSKAEMMLGEVGRTPLDIDFSLFGIPVRVHPLFWLVGIVLGWAADSPQLLVIWVMCLFVSILIHELGHALMARAFGYWPHIVLYGMGGYAAYQPGRDRSLWQSIAITFAGPLAGFMFFGVVVAVYFGLDFAEVDLNENMQYALFILIYINLFWGLVNLVPVLPLDGGQICRDVLFMLRRIDGELWALRISVVAGILMAMLMYQIGLQFAAIMFGLLALFNLQALGARSQY